MPSDDPWWDALRSYWPQISAVMQVGMPLLWGILLSVAVHRKSLSGGWAWTPLVPLFPLLAKWPEPRSPALLVPLTCWLVALLSVRWRDRTFHAGSLLFTGATMTGLQLWQQLG